MPTLNWIGKDKVINHHQDVSFRVLERRYEFGTPDSGNMIIHGDNLDALKALLPQYEGRVKLVYIDPPYNTGEENWIYNDNLNDPRIRKWFGEVVGKEGEDLSRHDKWLCMMYPRLRLLQRLLADDGAVFISIDDNELANLRLLCDEILGARNFAAVFIWEKRVTRENRKLISNRHDYIVCYVKNFDRRTEIIKLLEMNDEAIERYKNPDNDPRGVWTSVPCIAQAGHATPNQFYTLTTPAGRELNPPSGSCWRLTKERMNEAISHNRIWFGSDGKGVPRIKKFLNEGKQGLTPESLWKADDVGTNDTAKREIVGIFDGEAVFTTPKPTTLIRRILQIATDRDSIILDSFAGSGTTAHAVLNMNKEGGKRQFILVEMMDYAESITAERVRRVIDGYSSVEGTGGGFAYYELGEALMYANGNLNENVDTAKIREYVWYMETKQPVQSINLTENPYLLGEVGNAAYYFYYDKDMVTTLDTDFLAKINIKAERYIIYVDQCALPEEMLKRYNITFKKIPRDITRL
ncbi:MAG: site-specific DNA-methyltransferase [Clostridiales bacterium]|nr:site-specific DNA-methyltransferase [Clostridiales bacterium]